MRGDTRRRLARAVGLIVATACSSTTEVSVFLLAPEDVRRPTPPGSLGLEERLVRGQYLEVQRYLEGLPSAELDQSAVHLAFYGKALLARGDFEAAWPVLERARRLESRAFRRGEIEWAVSQGAILWNDFSVASDYAESAIRNGYGLVPGFLRFLAAMREVDANTGPAIGETHTADFDMRGFQLIRLPIRVNGLDTPAILDSGAVYTIVTESFARAARVREIPESNATGRGLHKKEFPVTFGVLDRLDFAGFSVRNVPVMRMPDEALLFETGRGQFPVPAVLGLHLLKEFSTEIDYRGRRLRLTRADFRVPKRESDQNLFFHRGRVFVRASINRNGFYQFLLDTGSEPTMMTTAGLARAGLPPANKLFPKRVYGMGKSRMEWGRIGEITIGIGGFGARFRDMVVKEDEGAIEDGILGSAFLRHFRVRIDFARMLLSLEKGH